MILMAIAFMPTSNKGTTEFPTHFALLKQKCKTCVHRPHAKKFPLIKLNKQALFQKFET